MTTLQSRADISKHNIIDIQFSVQNNVSNQKSLLIVHLKHNIAVISKERTYEYHYVDTLKSQTCLAVPKITKAQSIMIHNIHLLYPS